MAVSSITWALFFCISVNFKLYMPACSTFGKHEWPWNQIFTIFRFNLDCLLRITIWGGFHHLHWQRTYLIWSRQMMLCFIPVVSFSHYYNNLFYFSGWDQHPGLPSDTSQISQPAFSAHNRTEANAFSMLCRYWEWGDPLSKPAEGSWLSLQGFLCFGFKLSGPMQFHLGVLWKRCLLHREEE